MVSHLAVTAVRCVNCGGGADWPTLLALMFGGVGAIAAARSLSIQTGEHRRLMAELAKRADFKITVRPYGYDFARLDADSADLTSGVSALTLRFEVGVTNIGQRAATHTTLNLLAPVEATGLAWTGPNGEPVSRVHGPAETAEPLGGDSSRPGALWIDQPIERVAKRTPVVRFAGFGVELQGDAGKDVYIRVKAQSDDLPDDVAERIKDYVVHITRPPGLYPPPG